MAKKPLRSQLNQIRAWVRQGRTDAWIAHQLDVSASELREFRRRHELSAEDETGEVELRDEIEAEIEALSVAAEEEAAAAEEEAEGEGEESVEKPEGEGAGRRRRRRRRRGRGGGGERAGASMQATFDHGETDGYGLWLDPAVSDDQVYTEHWAGHRKVEVTIEPDRIVVRRV
jgi:uncharacterized protein YjcR